MYSDLTSYYLRWYHDRPVAITSARSRELQRLHRVLYACITHLVEHYEQYVPLFMPLSGREMDILAEQRRYPFKAGTYRPDYIITPDGRLLLCEITSRFFAHGIFMSWFARKARERFIRQHQGQYDDTAFDALMEHMRRMPQGRKRMFVLKSADKTSEIRLYRRFYEAMGMEVEVLEAFEVERRLSDWSQDAFVVSALNQRDLLSYSDQTLQAMMAAGMVSDFRNIFLIHDKRFLALWHNDAFTSACLNDDDTAFLRAHSIPTFLTMPEDLRRHKDRYILKPCRLGKSEDLWAGPLTTDEAWTRRIDAGTEGMIAQPFITQRTCSTVWEGTPFDDYFCGMMLCVDDRFYDAGFFRCSSLPVTNIGDNRKACTIHTDDPNLLPFCDIL